MKKSNLGKNKIDIVSGAEISRAVDSTLECIVESPVTSRYKVYYGDKTSGTARGFEYIDKGYISKTGKEYFISARIGGKSKRVDKDSIIRIINSSTKRDVFRHESFNLWLNSFEDNDGLHVIDIFNTEITLKYSDMNDKTLTVIPLIIIYNYGENISINDCLGSIDKSTGLIMEYNREKFREQLIDKSKMTDRLEYITSDSYIGNGVLYAGNTVVSVSESIKRLINIREYMLGNRSCM